MLHLRKSAVAIWAAVCVRVVNVMSHLTQVPTELLGEILPVLCLSLSDVLVGMMLPCTPRLSSGRFRTLASVRAVSSQPMQTARSIFGYL
jgi:hypothetical protein